MVLEQILFYKIIKIIFYFLSFYIYLLYTII